MKSDARARVWRSVLAFALAVGVLAAAGKAAALGLGSRLEQLEAECSLSYKGTREGLDVYACGWAATPAGQRYTGVAVDADGVVREIVLVNGDELATAETVDWLTAYYGEPERIGSDYLYWRARGCWIVLAPRDTHATAIEISTRNPARLKAVVTYRKPSARKSQASQAGGGRYQWDLRLGGKNGNGSQCRDTVTGRISKESNCR